MADMTRIKGRIAETIYPNGTGAITAESHQALLLEMVDTINREKADQSELVATQDSLEALTDTVNNLPQGGGDVKADGVYPDLTAGDLAGRGESVPAEFGFRASGGKSIKDGRAYIKAIKGNSVVWNNMVDTRGYEGGFFADLPSDIIQGHKYLLQRTHANDSLYLIAVINGEEKYEISLRNGVYAAIIESPYTGDSTRIFAEAYCGACVISDLTKMFGAGNEPSTIEEYEARKPIVEDEFAYNEGQVIHCNTESIKSVGDNAWDEEWELGSINMESGRDIEASNQIRPINYIRVLPNTEYHAIKGAAKALYLFYYDKDKNYLMYQDPFATSSTGGKFTTPQGVYYMRFFYYDTAYHNDICISLYHSGWKAQKDDQYQPYWQDTLPLPIIRKYFPDGMKSAGSAHDEIRFSKASGKWEKVVRITEVDLGTLNWYHDASLGGFYSDILVGAKKLFDGICAKYPFVGDYRNVTDKTCGYVNESCVLVKDSAYTDAASFKAAMQGVILYYELAEPVIREIDEPIGTDYRVADFGTEQAISSTPSAPFSADIIYQFNAVDMIREHEAEITELQKVIATMQAQLTSLINGGQ